MNGGYEMQSSAARADRILAWEQVDLPNQVYRVQNVRWLEQAPDFRDGWIDCSDNAQWAEELGVCLDILGEDRGGMWVGMGQTIAGVCHGLAWLVS